MSKESQEPISEYHDIFTKNYAKFVNILKINRLSHHFVSARIITLEEKDELTINSFLHTINSHLKSGIKESFLEMLDIMEHKGDIATISLAKRIKSELNICTTVPADVSSLVDFNEFDNTNDMFLALVSELQCILSEDKLPLVRRACITNDKQMSAKLPDEFVQKVTATTNLNDLFDAVTQSPFCNWMNIRLLEKMAAASLQCNAIKLIKKYKATISSLKLKDVLNQMQEVEITDDYYSKVKEKWNKELDELTVNDIISHWCRLEIIFDVDDATLLLNRIIEGSVVLCWLLPTELVCHARYSAFKMWNKLEDILYLEIGDHMIKDQQYDFKTAQIDSANPYEVIDHFTDFLLLYLNDDLLLLMYNHGLINKDEFDVVTSGPTRYHRNGLILEYVKQMDTASLLIFNEVLMESHPDITIPLMDALQYAGVVYPGRVAPLQSISLKISYIIEQSGVGNAMETQTASLSARPRKRHPSPDHVGATKHFKPSMVNSNFLKLTDKLNELVQFCDPKMIVEHCSSLMASDTHKIAVFPSEFVNSLHKYKHTPSLLKILSSFWTWSDHSVLRTILQSDEKALKLLEEYDYQLDPLHQIVSYPLPPPAPCMMPCDGSTHTILAVKCAHQYYQCLLKHVFGVRSLLLDKCDITPHCLQLLATKSSSTVMYWMIPKTVVTLISTKIIEHSNYFYSQGITEVDISPGIRIETKPSNLGPLGFLSAQPPSKFAVVTEVMRQPEKLPTVIEQLLLDTEQRIILHERHQVNVLEAHNKDAELKMRQMEKTIRSQNDKLEKMKAVMSEVESSKHTLEEEHQQILTQMEVKQLKTMEDTATVPDTATGPDTVETVIKEVEPLYLKPTRQQGLRTPSTRPQIKEQLLRQPVSTLPATATTPKRDDDSEKGYDYNFVKPPPEVLLCKICDLPARDPIQANMCCGQTFCKKCVDNYKSHTTACPNCKTQNVEFMNDIRAKREIGDLKVYCTLKTMGCSWVGELRLIQEHLKLGASISTGCQYTEVSCSNNCGMVMQRRLLEEHLNAECELRQVECQYCSSTGSYQWINGSHQEDCPKYPMECPNHCDIGQVTREEMSVHLEKCPLAIVKCPFAVVDCDSIVRRDEIMRHIEATTTQHMEYMIRGISSTMTQLQSARELFEQRAQELEVNFDNANLTNRTDLEEVKYNLSVTMNKVDEAKKSLADHDESLRSLLVEAQSLRKRAINTELELKEYNPALDHLKHQLTVSSEQLQLEMQKVYEVNKELQDKKLSAEQVKENLEIKLRDFRDELSEAKKSVTSELNTTKGDANNRLTTEKISVDNLNSQLQESRKELGVYKVEIDMLKQNLEKEAQKSKDASTVTEEALLITRQELQRSQERFEALLKLHDWDLQLKFLHATSSNVLPDVFLKMTDFNKSKSTKEVWYSPSFYTEHNGYKMCLSVSLSHTAGYVSLCVLLMCGEYDNHLRWPIRGSLKLQLMNQMKHENHTDPVEIVFDGSDESSCCQRVMAGERARFGNYFGKFISHKLLVADVKRKIQYLKEDTLYFKLLTFMTPVKT
ncbi:uncharacterized protein [Dysidea avara]